MLYIYYPKNTNIDPSNERLTELIEKLSSMGLSFGMDVESYLESEG